MRLLGRRRPGDGLRDVRVLHLLRHGDELHLRERLHEQPRPPLPGGREHRYGRGERQDGPRRPRRRADELSPRAELGNRPARRRLVPHGRREHEAHLPLHAGRHDRRGRREGARLGARRRGARGVGHHLAAHADGRAGRDSLRGRAQLRPRAPRRPEDGRHLDARREGSPRRRGLRRAARERLDRRGPRDGVRCQGQPLSRRAQPVDHREGRPEHRDRHDGGRRRTRSDVGRRRRARPPGDAPATRGRLLLADDGAPSTSPRATPPSSAESTPRRRSSRRSRAAAPT